MRNAQAQVPHSVLQRAADRIPYLAGALIVGGLIAYSVFDSRFGLEGRYLLVAWSVGLLVLLVLAERVSDGELSKRFVLVRARLKRLAEERNRRIDDANAFYASPEWKILRDATIKEQGRICRDCGAEIGSHKDVTVSHVLPRGKYPHLALSRDNVQVRCRSCNSKKRDRELK
jgi:hypothetical protein